MALVSLCRLDENGRGGWHGVVQGEKRGDGGWMVPDGTKFILWTLGDPRINAFLLTALQPRHVGQRDTEKKEEQLLCRMWHRKEKEKQYFGKLNFSMLQDNTVWEWVIPMGLRFMVFDDRGKKRGFGLTIAGVAPER